MSRLTGRCMNTSSRGGNLKQYAYMSMRQVLCLTVREAVVHRQIMKNALCVPNGFTGHFFED